MDLATLHASRARARETCARAAELKLEAQDVRSKLEATCARAIAFAADNASDIAER